MSAAFNPSFDRYESFHKLTTAVNMSKNIEHDRSGKASIINGDIFYSPNSSFDVRLPLPVEENSRIWRHAGKSKAAEFQVVPSTGNLDGGISAGLSAGLSQYPQPVTTLLFWRSGNDVPSHTRPSTQGIRKRPDHSHAHCAHSADRSRTFTHAQAHSVQRGGGSVTWANVTLGASESVRVSAGLSDGESVVLIPSRR